MRNYVKIYEIMWKYAEHCVEMRDDFVKNSTIIQDMYLNKYYKAYVAYTCSRNTTPNIIAVIVYRTWNHPIVITGGRECYDQCLWGAYTKIYTEI